MDDKLIFKLQQISDYYDIPVTTLQKHVRDKKLIATKNGKEYIVTKDNLDNYLGIKSNDKEMKKDLEILRLQNELEIYKNKIEILKNLVETINKFIENDRGKGVF